jgi:hypothetical protein
VAVSRDIGRPPDLYLGKRTFDRHRPAGYGGLGIGVLVAARDIGRVGTGGAIHVDAADAKVHVPHDQRPGGEIGR